MAYTTIDNPFKYFNTVLYSGTGSSQSITGVGFQPDWLWIKRRNAVGSHRIQDSIRGTANYLQSDKTDAEASGGDVDAFLSNGFSLSGGATAYNVSGGTYVGWSWLAGGSGSSNSDGSITSSVSANTTAGFSIVSYTGTGANATVGHGLGVAPKMIILKKYDVTGSWGVYHHSLGNSNHLYLQNTDASTSSSTIFNSTSPTSSVFSIGANAISNGSSNTHIAYCLAEKKGYSKFGSYTGNGNADGTFIHTGFKPAWFMVKRTNTSGNPWIINDNKRDPFNFCRENLFADASDAEVDVTSESGTWDLLSNGVKMRNSGTSLNGSGSTYIYLAFAEAPFVTAGTKAAGTAR